MCFCRLYFCLFPLIMSSNVDNHIKNTGCTNNSFTRKISNIYFWLRFGLANSMIIQGYKFVLCVQGIFNLKCLLIEFVIPNLSQIYFCVHEIFKTNVSNRLYSTKSPFEFVFSSCELTKVILQSKSWCVCSY